MNLKLIILFSAFCAAFLQISANHFTKNIVLLGPPGAGKGTFAQELCRQGNDAYEHICIGDLLRAEVRKKTDLGKQIEELIAQGTLIDIRITATLVEQKIHDILSRKKLFILDGFPRSFSCLPYFKTIMASLSSSDAPICFICLDLDTESCLNRISQRYVCTQCDHVYHKNLDGISPDTSCSQCSVHLSRRANDTIEVAQKRLADYHATIKPMIEVLKKEFQTHVINNSGTRDALHQQINTVY